MILGRSKLDNYEYYSIIATIEPLRQNLEIVSLCKILQFSLLNFD